MDHTPSLEATISVAQLDIVCFSLLETDRLSSVLRQTSTGHCAEPGEYCPRPPIQFQ
jgi:hypothetical protein